ncbi:hypothetical protein PG993_011493 [Apiospora rasikravindrae]|uniref:Uncharacterized protein n=1 Tax=Apiospora rasikravindrae TaxID=990691 RepID=A0ABR1SED8_9PEZI
MITLQQAIDGLESPYEKVAQLLDKAVELRTNGVGGGDQFWCAVAREVPWSSGLSPNDISLLVADCVRHYRRRGGNAAVEMVPCVDNMYKAIGKWCELLAPEELGSIVPPFSDNNDEGSETEQDDSEDSFVSEGEANRLRQISQRRRNPLYSLSGETLVEEEVSPPGDVGNGAKIAISSNDGADEPNSPWNVVNDLEVFATYQANARERELGSLPRPRRSRFRENFAQPRRSRFQENFN